MKIVLIVLAAILLSDEFSITVATTVQNTTDLFVYDFRCSEHSGEYTKNSSYQYSLYNLLGQLTTESSRAGFYHSSYGQNPDKVFGHYMCRDDMGSEGCSKCVETAKDKILEKCPYQTGALIWYELCMVRFSNESFFGKVEVLPRDSITSPRNVTGNRTKFAQLLRDTMNHLAVQAAGDERSGIKFASTEVNLTGTFPRNLYALAQCTPDLTNSVCIWCLKAAIDHLEVAAGAVVLQPSCCVRYKDIPFLGPTANFSLSPATPKSQEMSPGTNQSGRRHHSMLRIFAFIGVSISITILLGIGIWMYSRKQKGAKSFKLEINVMRTVDSLQFDLSIIKAATHNFSADNKLGEGGFGEVYKGVLEDGQKVAIKRLSKKSGQGIEEFKTEVVLVAKLQHKNLVKLLGFCLSSTEKLLIYELLQNSSLDRFLFDAEKKVSLDWETRYKLIVGIARGLQYLHEDSRLKVIHRDLKPSNILLDEGMNPKISDFGLARLFGVDQTQDDTKRIVGTYGYMAPEYVITGHFSTKSDVYSFGIIMLEIVSGQKNSFFGRQQLEDALLYRAWRLWNESRTLHLVDTTMDSKYPIEEVTKCINLALLCVQENAAERPRMAAVVAALNGSSTISLPMPKPPNFFGNNSSTTNDIYYNQLIGGNEMEYGKQLDRQSYPYVYSGAETITDSSLLHPR